MLRPTVIEDGVKRRERDYFWGKHKGIRATTYGGRRENQELDHKQNLCYNKEKERERELWRNLRK